MFRPVILASMLVFLSAASARAAARVNQPLERPTKLRLYYLEMRKVKSGNVDAIIATMKKAAAAGYHAAVLADSNFAKMGMKDDSYFNLLRKVNDAAKELKMEIVPVFGSLGYGTPFLRNDMNLAEGIRITDAPFKVAGGKAQALLEPETRIPNGGFDKFKGHAFSQLRAQDAPGQATFVDTKVKASGKASCRLEMKGSNKVARARFLVNVRPWRSYRIRFKARTKGVQGGKSIIVEVDGKHRNLSRQDTRVKFDQDWNTHAVVFNSWDNEVVKFDIGLWNWATKKGTAWIDDVRIEPVGLLNVLRRPGCPLVVRDEKGQVYEEGKDFTKVSDPELGRTDSLQTPPPLVIRQGSRIKEGAELYVSSYAPLINSTSQMAVCLSEPRVWEVMAGNLRKLKEIFAPTEYVCSLDEVRLANHCQACRSRKLSSGQLIGAASRTIYETLKKVDPQADMMVWNDIFDPHHNALRKNYYYVPGTYEGSWERLPKEVVVANWKRKKKSLAFFAGRGHRQVICGYYGNPNRIGNLLKESADLGGIKGVMFCLYNKGSFDDLGAFARNALAAQ